MTSEQSSVYVMSSDISENLKHKQSLRSVQWSLLEVFIINGIVKVVKHTLTLY